MKALIVYGTTEGQTRKICEFLEQEMLDSGHKVTVNDTAAAQLYPEHFDAVVVAASVHAGRYQTSIEHYVQEHLSTLNKKPTIFVSVSLTAATDEPESWKELEEVTQNFLTKTGWQPNTIEQVAGALRYSKYNFLKRFIMRMIAQKTGGGTDTSEDYEYTDWSQVKGLVTKLEKLVAEQPKTTV